MKLDGAAPAWLVPLVDEGKRKTPVAAIYPLEQAAAAQAALKLSHPPGKIVLVA